jgi:hypothetical protein
VIPQFIVAGAIALLAAAIHGGAGEALVLRKLFAGELPSTRFGGPAATRVMIRVTWHIATLTSPSQMLIGGEEDEDRERPDAQHEGQGFRPADPDRHVGLDR